MEYCVNLLVSVPIEAVEDATVEELIYQAEKMLGKEVERLATAQIKNFLVRGQKPLHFCVPCAIAWLRLFHYTTPHAFCQEFFAKFSQEYFSQKACNLSHKGVYYNHREELNKRKRY